jgi:hypothetical protein
MERYTSPALRVPASTGAGRHDRVDLELHGLDHSGQSFAVRVFIDDPNANVESLTAANNPHFAGSFFIFGHGPCLGDEGHCEVPPGPIHPFDFREPHPLAPKFRRLTITEPLRATVADSETFTVTLVPVANHGGSYEGGDLLTFTRLSLVAYS